MLPECYFVLFRNNPRHIAKSQKQTDILRKDIYCVKSNMLIAKRLEKVIVKNCKEIASEWEVPIRTVND